jgi:hypothetical protein
MLLDEYALGVFNWRVLEVRYTMRKNIQVARVLSSSADDLSSSERVIFPGRSWWPWL